MKRADANALREWKEQIGEKLGISQATSGRCDAELERSRAENKPDLVMHFSVPPCLRV